MTTLTDVHCHLLPYVDDGAENAAQAAALLAQEAAQGVSRIILTPHCRAGMFETPDDKIQLQYERLCRTAAQGGLPALYLGREYHCDALFMEKLRSRSLCTLAGSRYVLMEFSAAHTAAALCGYLDKAVQYGYRPVIAHAERYPCLMQEPALLGKLVKSGMCVQINADSVLGMEGWKQKRLCRSWMQQDLVHLVGSDAHNTGYRAPHLAQAARYIEKKMGAAYAKTLLQDNPNRIFDRETVSDETVEARKAGAPL